MYVDVQTLCYKNVFENHDLSFFFRFVDTWFFIVLRQDKILYKELSHCQNITISIKFFNIRKNTSTQSFLQICVIIGANTAADCFRTYVGTP